jgi:MFS transporter, DHA2 family, lincomycin resistance protein
MTGRLPLATLCAAQFVFVLDVAVVNVALVPLAADLGVDPFRLQVLGWSYAATFGGLLLLGGRVADGGRRRGAFVAGLVVFALASLLCGAAPSVPALVAGRLLQGAGAALASPAALSLLAAVYTDERSRARALGVWAGVAAAGGAAGLVLGGLLTSHWGWRWVFLVNLPVVAAVVLAARATLPPGRPPYVSWREADPLLPADVRALRSTRLANAMTALMSMTVIGTNFFLAVHLQQRIGLTALQTGLAFLPLTAVSAATASLSARVVGAVPVGRLLAIGMGTMAVGAGWLATLPADGGYLRGVLPGMVLVAAGMGPGFGLGTLAALADVPSRHHGSAAALLATSTQLGAAVGLVALEAVSATAVDGADGLRRAFLAMTAASLLAAAAGALLRPPPARKTLPDAVAIHVTAALHRDDREGELR